jgi:hypothetical protein
VIDGFPAAAVAGRRPRAAATILVGPFAAPIGRDLARADWTTPRPAGGAQA